LRGFFVIGLSCQSGDVLLPGGLAAIIGYRLLTGQINTKYLLYGMRRDGTRYFSPERVQLLVATFSIAIQYLLNAAQAAPGKVPDLPAGSLQLLGLSHAIYLGGKDWAAFKEKV
jgi:hypothetical protein